AWTGSGGMHIFFAHALGVRNVTRLAGLAGLDVRGDGGYVVVPPSIHASGNYYEWAKPLDTTLAPWPPDLLALVVSQNAARSTSATSGSENGAPIREGHRNDALVRLAGAMRRIGASEESIVAALAEDNTSRCFPPLDPREVEAIARSVARYPP